MEQKNNKIFNYALLFICYGTGFHPLKKEIYGPLYKYQSQKPTGLASLVFHEGLLEAKIPSKSPFIGEELICHNEKENEQDEFAIGVYRNKFVVGHMLFYLSKAECKFFTIPNSKLCCRVIGKLWSTVWRFFNFFFYLVLCPTSYIQAQFTRLHR